MAKTERIEFRVSLEFLGRVDAARGDVSRSRWILRALENTLADAEAGWVRDVHGQVVGQEPYKLPPSKPSPRPAVPPSRVPGVRPAREFVLDPRQARVNASRKK